MGTRTFNVLVVVFWLAATTWLVVAKIVPHMASGTPPEYLVRGGDQTQRDEIVCWTIDQVGAESGRNARIGWAAGRGDPRTGGRSELQSRVFVWRLPTPTGPVMRTLFGWAKIDTRLELGIDSSIYLDRDSQLNRFESSVHIGDGEPWCTIVGTNNDGQLDVTARVNRDKPQQIASYWMGGQSVVSDANAPRGYMPDLKEGQSWKTHQLSPLKGAGGSPVSTEDLEATVKRREDILWEGGQEKCWLVEYHRDSGAGSRWAETPSRQTWVRCSDGMVLRDEIAILGFRLKFLRVPPNKAEGLAAKLEKDWSARIDKDTVSSEGSPHP